MIGTKWILDKLSLISPHFFIFLYCISSSIESLGSVWSSLMLYDKKKNHTLKQPYNCSFRNASLEPVGAVGCMIRASSHRQFMVGGFVAGVLWQKHVSRASGWTRGYEVGHELQTTSRRRLGLRRNLFWYRAIFKGHRWIEINSPTFKNSATINHEKPLNLKPWKLWYCFRKMEID